MAIDFVAIAKTCRDAAAGRNASIDIKAINAFLEDFYARGESFAIFVSVSEPLREALIAVNAVEPKTLLQAAVETVQRKVKQPEQICLAFRRFAAVMELAQQLSEILHETEPELPEVQPSVTTEECTDRGCSATAETDIPLSDVRPSGTDANDSVHLQDA